MKTHRLLILAAGLLVGSSALAQTSTAPGRPAVTPARPTTAVSDHARAVNVLLDQFKAQREQYMAARHALIERLKTANADDRRAILEQLRAAQQDRVDEQRAMGKEIREELKNLREKRKNGGG